MIDIFNIKTEEELIQGIAETLALIASNPSECTINADNSYVLKQAEEIVNAVQKYVNESNIL